MLAALIALVAKYFSPIFVAFRWIRTRLSMCRVSIGKKWENGASEQSVRWIHIPVAVQPGWLGATPVVGAEVEITEAPNGFDCPMQLFWQNRADSDKPERQITLRPGNYLIPFAARTTLNERPLSARAVTLVPGNLWKSWLLKRGVVRITNGAHFFTFVGLVNLSKRDFLNFTISIKDQLGNIIADRKLQLAIPEVDADNKYFYVI